MKLLHHSWLRRDMETYKDLLCGCAPGTHRRVLEMLLDHVHPPHARVLDLGAGSGALLLRLRDAGFTDLEAADMAASNWGMQGVRYTRVDLNGRFSSSFQRKFRIACLSEVIEHLDSPREALTQARELLEDDGYLLLTVPNVAFWEGRLKFAVTGELWGFSEATYRTVRHISPMTRSQIALTLQEIGFRVIAFATAGSFATPLRRALLAPLWLPMVAIAGREVLGECTVFLAQKAPPDVELTKPTDFYAAWVGPATEASAASRNVESRSGYIESSGSPRAPTV